MNSPHFFLISALIPSILQAMLPETPSTLIKSNKEKKSFSEWIRDDQKKEFGNTEKITLDEIEEVNQPAGVKRKFSIKKTSVYTST